MSKISDSNAAEAKAAQHVAEQNVAATPNAGTTGSHADCDETLNHGRTHDVQTDFVAHESVGAAKRSTVAQVFGTPPQQGGSDGKQRTAAVWGVKTDKSQGKK
jgi:hypothetical protein